MRTNGFDHHMALARGELSWTENEGVRQTFENWRTLIDMGAFIDDHQTYSWQEALPFMVNGEATSYLMGNFVVPQLRDAGLNDDQIDFYQFPAINPDVAMGEDAPTDTFHVASGAQNVEAAREFLKFVTSAEVQTEINGPGGLGQLPINANASSRMTSSSSRASPCCRKTPPAGSRSSSIATSRPRWPRSAWKGCRSSWSFPTTWTTSWPGWKTRASASTTDPARPGPRCGAPRHPHPIRKPGPGFRMCCPRPQRRSRRRRHDHRPPNRRPRAGCNATG